jgi:hypothetical protein
MAGELVKGSCEEAAPAAAAPAAAAVVMPGELLPKSSSRRCRWFILCIYTSAALTLSRFFVSK